jgi:CheY-like chemotaxis protein
MRTWRNRLYGYGNIYKSSTKTEPTHAFLHLGDGHWSVYKPLSDFTPPSTIASRHRATDMVDDHPARLLTYESLLAGVGVTCVRALLGEEALSRLLKQSFALILLDVSLPGMDGFETARMIREHPRFERTPNNFCDRRACTSPNLPIRISFPKLFARSRSSRSNSTYLHRFAVASRVGQSRSQVILRSSIDVFIQSPSANRIPRRA